VLAIVTSVVGVSVTVFAIVVLPSAISIVNGGRAELPAWTGWLVAAGGFLTAIGILGILVVFRRSSQ
jgi:type II secretory pathway component PulF